MKKILIIAGGFFITLAAIQVLIPVPEHVGLTLIMQIEHCDESQNPNFQYGLSCIEARQIEKLVIAESIVGLILVVSGTLFQSMKKKWLASSMMCLFFGIYFIIANIQQNIRYHGSFFDCWYEAYGQIGHLESICYGPYNGFILGVGIFAIGILIIILKGIKKNRGDSK